MNRVFARSFQSIPSWPIRIDARFLSQQSNKPNVWVLTDGGIQSTLLGMTLGKRLGNTTLKTTKPSQGMQLLPPILQKFIVSWSSKRTRSNDQLPWYLETQDPWQGTPDYVVCTSPLAIPACLTASTETNLSVYAGFPSIPFLYFDQVVLPKYEAQGKLAKLGPYARQKNMIATNMPVLDIQTQQNPSRHEHTAIVVGGYSPQCRWYSEDAATLAENMRRMVDHFHTKLVVVFTEKTSEQVKERIKSVCGDRPEITLWDAMTEVDNTLERVEKYQSIIDHAARVVLTADLDYATAHAASRRKPVYIAFGDRCRSHLLHFQRWAREKHITRKLRLDKSRAASRKKQVDHSTDPFSYLGNHAAWADGRRVLEIPNTLEHVVEELESKRMEKITGKRQQ
ncbi:hypothetical protein O0I10_009337 [Lichtheimia ornata]|uniref:Mitochondrial fission protein n=1 Tax=Lichtheimia ornata TaxID=688661 RepID=A0AAD7UZG3_9FUNG|nr:uncharacterized protein O0I10_009337 [Lichtheimia ornata]KAJ8654941.1 hypothetical protein O0I10_009337 [Lichtheimia ornata]